MVRERVLVVGGGTMGRGIAAVCALAGYPTSVFEADPAGRGRLRAAIESSWQRAVERGRMTSEAAHGAQKLLEVPERLEQAAGADLAVEAVPEDISVKRGVFSELDRLCPRAAFLASNTSALSISEIASATRQPARVVGLHFFNPVATMPLVELVRGTATSEATLDRAAAFAESLGKQTIRVADAPGFATSRLGVALGLEAMRMVEEGVASASDIDRAMELGYGHRMGPLKTSDLVGLDVRLAIAETLARGIDPERFAPPAILRRLVSEGKTGRKSGEGFYRWDEETGQPSESAGPR
ncbi:MAG TPA: 3-hydroxyacyl-CoA dehydrogenase family protein [Thermoanaerobaculia bacterium]|nr:3-hydroxyacyl-CoA dehydrogenase family protein [Thermoanaerobaculia bacterium]